uniref:Uncharacterized protein n=1 Tax=Rhizophora mucronata TaxID=61149 RepID=A0A2P2K157_RHIMU
MLPETTEGAYDIIHDHGYKSILTVVDLLFHTLKTEWWPKQKHATGIITR